MYKVLAVADFFQQFNIWENVKNNIYNMLVQALSYNLNEISKFLSGEHNGLKEGLTNGVKVFNPTLLAYAQKVHNNVFLPIGSIVLVYVILMKLYDLIQMNNTNFQLETKYFIKWGLESAIAYWFLRNSFTWVMASLELGNWLSARLTVDTKTVSVTELVNNTNSGDLVGAVLLSFLVLWAVQALSFIMPLIMYALFFEMYIWICLSAVPMATLMKDSWSNVGVNYIKNVFALALTGVIMLICLSMSPHLMQGIIDKASGTVSALMSIVISQIFLVMVLVKAKPIAKSVLGAN